MKALSYIPFTTAVDQLVSRIFTDKVPIADRGVAWFARRSAKRDAKQLFLQSAGEYKPSTVKRAYDAVAGGLKRVFSRDYEPSPMPN